ncbi:unnamed protein product [Moneuplotes crassus]|uniref:EF-hand domain-containing protein n=1 Tax=Euplotes crassus TaxID=5936 RepID=A0AAD1UDZ4_EUPCR|nr:unnamed protein product [Moneuplotes crassus]
MIALKNCKKKLRKQQGLLDEIEPTRGDSKKQSSDRMPGAVIDKGILGALQTKMNNSKTLDKLKNKEFEFDKLKLPYQALRLSDKMDQKLFKIFEEEAIKAGLEVKPPESRNLRAQGYNTSIGFYDKKKQCMIEKRLSPRVNVGGRKIFQMNNLKPSKRSSSQYHRINKQEPAEQYCRSLLPQTTRKTDHYETKRESQLNTARHCKDPGTIDTVSERTEKTRSIKRKNSKYSRGDHDDNRKGHHRSQFTDSKHDENTKKNHPQKLPSLPKHPKELTNFELDQNFFKLVCSGDGPEIIHMKHCIINRANFKLFLSKKYPPKIADRITFSFFQSIGNPLVLNYDKYSAVLDDFLKSPPEHLLIFAFSCYDLSATNSVCEHDIFQILQIFKEEINVDNQILEALQLDDFPTDLDLLVKDEKSYLFEQIFIPDVLKMSECLTSKNNDKLSLNRLNSKFSTMSSKFSRIPPDHEVMFEKSIKRAEKIEEHFNKNTLGSVSNIFEHKNIYYNTRLNHPECNSLSSEDFLSIKFECKIPHLLNDFILYITGEKINLHKIYNAQARKNKYLSKIGQTSLPFQYSKEDLNSVEHWKLVHKADRSKEDGSSVARLEEDKEERKNKRSHILPIGHQLLPLREFYQYIDSNHLKNLEKSFIKLAKKDSDIYITQESLSSGFKEVFGYENPSLAKRFYMYLAEYHTKARITFEQYLRRFFKLLYSSVVEKNQISFRFYDYDGDGIISALDVYDLYQYYEKGSKLYEEATLLVNDIAQNSQQNRREDRSFNYNYFLYIVKSSYITKECVNKCANGITNLSYHEARCTAKWNSILHYGNLEKKPTKSFKSDKNYPSVMRPLFSHISLLMRRTEKKKKEEKEREELLKLGKMDSYKNH